MRNAASPRAAMICLRCRTRQARPPAYDYRGLFDTSLPSRSTPSGIRRLSIRYLASSDASESTETPHNNSGHRPKSSSAQNPDAHVSPSDAERRQSALDLPAELAVRAQQRHANSTRKEPKGTAREVPATQTEANSDAPESDPYAHPQVPTPWSRGESNVHAFTPAELDPPKPLTGIDQPPIAQLAHGLDRVLFNPGVYRMRDDETKVYNFDPFLATLLKVQDFKFEALSTFKPPSKDALLAHVAKTHRARYSASTSSLTSPLTHFHYLLSHWRPIDMGMLSRSFELPIYKHSYTTILRSAASATLRHKDGVYYLNGDSSYPMEYPETYVLARLGHVVEKLLTSSPPEFNRYRKEDPFQFTPEMQQQPEHYHFATRGNILTRAQLDAYDPRLPGDGTFDIKSRAALPIRMSALDPADMLGYQITRSDGTFESFEREYHDMLRSIMLKYSLQVRLGNMNGVFVAYHNIEDVFGFQFISVAEMDRALHGQEQRHLGDQELAASMHLLEKALDQITSRFGTEDLRLWFETRPTQQPTMYICAQPLSKAIEGSDEDSWCATLETRSTWQGKPVARPGRMTKENKSDWQIQSKMIEMTSDRAARTLRQIKTRRDGILDFSRAKALELTESIATTDPDAPEVTDLASAMLTARSDEQKPFAMDILINECKRLAAKGRHIRQRTRAQDRGAEAVVYRPLSEK